MTQRRYAAPIKWLNGDGQERRDPRELVHAFLDVEIAYNANGPWFTTTFQVDTGLSKTSVLPSLLKQIGSPKTGTVKLSGAAGWQEFSCHICLLRFPGYPDQAIGVEVATLDHPLGNTSAGGLLGMDAMLQGTLHLDPSGGPSFFEIPVAGEPQSAAQGQQPVEPT